MSENNQPDITTLTVQLVSAFVSNNNVASEGLADLIRTTRLALTDDLAAKPEEAAAPTYTPAVSVRKSLSSPEHILSMIDGKPYKTLKRHLASHGLSPNEYRERYGLPKSYPLVAPNYSEARRAVATKLGLGRKPVNAKKPAEAAPAPAASTASTPKSAPAKTSSAKPAAEKSPAKSSASKTAEAKVTPAKPAETKAPAAKPAEAKPAATKAPADKPAASRKRLSIATPAAAAPKKNAASAGGKSAEKPAAGTTSAKAPAKAAAKKKPAAKSVKAPAVEKA